MVALISNRNKGIVKSEQEQHQSFPAPWTFQTTNKVVLTIVLQDALFSPTFLKLVFVRLQEIKANKVSQSNEFRKWAVQALQLTD